MRPPVPRRRRRGRRRAGPGAPRRQPATARTMTRRPRAVPVGRPGARRRAPARRPGACWRSATRTPTPTRSGRRSRSPGSSRPRGGSADLLCTDPDPAALRVHARDRALPDRSRPGRGLRPGRSSSTAARSSGSATVGVRHADLFERLPRVIIDHHASNDAAGEADWIDPAAAATCEMVDAARGAARRRPRRPTTGRSPRT